MANETRMESSPQLEPTIAALRGAYQAFNRGDIEAAAEPLDAQIEWTEPAEFPGGGTYRGRDEVKHYLTQSRAAWQKHRANQSDLSPPAIGSLCLSMREFDRRAATSGKMCAWRTSTRSAVAN